MTETIVVVFGLIIAAGLTAIIALLLRPRAPLADPAAEQRLAEMNANLQRVVLMCRTHRPGVHSFVRPEVVCDMKGHRLDKPLNVQFVVVGVLALFEPVEPD